jgi:hypothetical protein
MKARAKKNPHAFLRVAAALSAGRERHVPFRRLAAAFVAK